MNTNTQPESTLAIPNMPDNMDMLTVCGASALHYALQMRKGERFESYPCNHLHLVFECHESMPESDPNYSKFDWRFWSINGQSVGNQYGLIASFMQIVITHTIDATAQRAESLSRLVHNDHVADDIISSIKTNPLN
jgi:hypothetical protein